MSPLVRVRVTREGSDRTGILVFALSRSSLAPLVNDYSLSTSVIGSQWVIVPRT